MFERLKLFWRTQKPKAIVLFTAIGLALTSFSSVTIYALLNPAQQQVWLFYLIVVSAWTSFFGVFWALYGIWKYHFEIDRAKREIYSRLGGDLIEKIGKVLGKANQRFMKLKPKQQGALIRLLEQGIDYGFAKVEEISTRPPGFNPPKGLKLKKRRKEEKEAE